MHTIRGFIGGNSNGQRRHPYQHAAAQAYKNDGFYTKEHIDTPILIDGVCAGVVTDVDKEYVYGTIWDKYVSKRIFADSGKLCDIVIEVKYRQRTN
jgi:hypothetical protein